MSIYESIIDDVVILNVILCIQVAFSCFYYSSIIFNESYSISNQIPIINY